MSYSLVTAAADPIAVGAASVQHALVMVANVRYLFISSTLCYVKQAANPTAVANAVGNSLVPPNFPVVIEGNLGAKLAVIQSAAGGFATLTPIKE